MNTDDKMRLPVVVAVGGALFSWACTPILNSILFKNEIMEDGLLFFGQSENNIVSRART